MFDRKQVRALTLNHFSIPYRNEIKQIVTKIYSHKYKSTRLSKNKETSVIIENIPDLYIKKTENIHTETRIRNHDLRNGKRRFWTELARTA